MITGIARLKGLRRVKKIGSQVLLMLSEDCLAPEVFWFRLYWEIGNILTGNYGISFQGDPEMEKNPALRFAEDSLVSPVPYQDFVSRRQFDDASVCSFAEQIGRAPEIVQERLRRDGLVSK